MWQSASDFGRWLIWYWKQSSASPISEQQHTAAEEAGPPQYSKILCRPLSLCTLLSCAGYYLVQATIFFDLVHATISLVGAGYYLFVFVQATIAFSVQATISF